MTTIYYFTRTGGSETIANEIAKQTNGVVRQITDHKNWKGFFGFLKAGYYATAKKQLPAYYEKPSADDIIYLCFPIWSGSFPPAVTTFIQEVGRERIIAVPTSMKSPLSDKQGFASVIEVIGKDKTIQV